FNIGLIGLGGMANAHIHGFRNVPGITIFAICDVSEEALERVGSHLGIRPDKRYSDYRQMIQDEEVNAVISITPNGVHAEIMKSCIEAGKPFLSEKPFTMTYEEAEELRKVYDKQSVPAMIGFSYRYTPAFRFARQLIKQNKLGTIR